MYYLSEIKKSDTKYMKDRQHILVFKDRESKKEKNVAMNEKAMKIAHVLNILKY